MNAQKLEAMKYVSQEKNSDGKALLVEIPCGLPNDKTAILKVFKDDDPHELAVKFCKKHNPKKPVEYYENLIKKYVE